jgi:NADPH:quinone reductase
MLRKQPDFGDSVIPGMEIVGEVVEVGTAATGFRNGDRVMAIVGGGAHAEYARVDSRMAMAFPTGSSLPPPPSTKSLSRRTKR